MPRPWLSVVMPTYNGAPYLAQALASVAPQSSDVEVIAVDDGSTDDTLEVLRRFSQRMDLKIVAGAHHGNWAASTNAGMRIAAGEYVCWLHQDDAWRPNRVRVLRALATRYSDSTLFIHPCWYCRADGRRVGYWRCPLPLRTRPFGPAEILERLLVQCWIASCGAVFRADVAARVGPLNENLWYSADWDYWLRLARAGTTVSSPLPLASFRLHAGSQTITRIRGGDVPDDQQAWVLNEHLAYFRRTYASRASVEAVARFSADANVALARALNGEGRQLPRLAGRFLALGPQSWLRYFRDSRIVERCISRVLAGVLKVPVDRGLRTSGHVVDMVQDTDSPSAVPRLALSGVRKCVS